VPQGVVCNAKCCFSYVPPVSRDTLRQQLPYHGELCAAPFSHGTHPTAYKHQCHSDQLRRWSTNDTIARKLAAQSSASADLPYLMVKCSNGTRCTPRVPPSTPAPPAPASSRPRAHPVQLLLDSPSLRCMVEADDVWWCTATHTSLITMCNRTALTRNGQLSTATHGCRR